MAAFEAAGIECWCSATEGDFEPDVAWNEKTTTALENSIAVVLILSDASNNSKWVLREIRMASALNLPIYPFRIEGYRP